MGEQRTAGERHQHFGVAGFHPLAFASGKDDDVQQGIRHESTKVIETRGNQQGRIQVIARSARLSSRGPASGEPSLPMAHVHSFGAGLSFSS
jgi:hypothetical protein